jgi:hypothetical protein
MDEELERQIWEAINTWTGACLDDVNLAEALRYDMVSLVHRYLKHEEITPCDHA